MIKNKLIIESSRMARKEVLNEKKRNDINCTWNYTSDNFNIAINIHNIIGL